MIYTTHILAEIASLLGEKRALANRLAPEDMKCQILHMHGVLGSTQKCPVPADMPVPAAAAAAVAFDAAMLFVSDHGESLGEHGLYLHGAPYAIAPDEQTHVPMLLWASQRYSTRRDIDLGCVRDRADAPLSHDNFFHSVLGLADVRTDAHRPALDLFAACRKTHAAARIVATGG